MGCRVDTQPNHWFQCANGTVGCPIMHDGIEPHCIACAAGDPCSYHGESEAAIKKPSWFRRLMCKIGHHRPLEWDYHVAGGGAAKCVSCGKEGLVDSQGNLF